MITYIYIYIYIYIYNITSTCIACYQHNVIYTFINVKYFDDVNSLILLFSVDQFFSNFIEEEECIFLFIFSFD